MTEFLTTCFYHTKLVGWLQVTVSEQGICALSFVDSPLSSAMAPWPPLARHVMRELDAYFAGKLKVFSVPLEPLRGSAFQHRVWAELMSIPFGETRSYRDIAKALGNPGLARAVGAANGANPVPIIIPCHRVIRSDGTLGGYSSGIHIKKKLLAWEGNEV